MSNWKHKGKDVPKNKQHSKMKRLQKIENQNKFKVDSSDYFKTYKRNSCESSSKKGLKYQELIEISRGLKSNKSGFSKYLQSEEVN